MTVLAGVAFDPRPDAPGFVLIASESKSYAIDVYRNRETLEITKTELVSTDDHVKKVFKLNSNLIISFAGNGFGGSAEEEVSPILKRIHSETNLQEAADIAREILMDRASLRGVEQPIQFRIPEQFEVKTFFSGVNVPPQIKERFIQRSSQNGGSITQVRLALEAYIRESAKLFPETCNEIIQVERIKF